MLCSLHAHSMLKPIPFWPATTRGEAFRLLPWNDVLETTSGFQLSFWLSYHTGNPNPPCNKTVGSALCLPLLQQALPSFDVVLLNSGLEYHDSDHYERDLQPLFNMLQQAVQQHQWQTRIREGLWTSCQTGLGRVE